MCLRQFEQRLSRWLQPRLTLRSRDRLRAMTEADELRATQNMISDCRSAHGHCVTYDAIEITGLISARAGRQCPSVE